MIEISFGKLLLLALIALIVLGPEKLPTAARTAGALLRRVRTSWDSVRAEVERELQVDEIRRTAREAVARMDAAQAELDTTLQQVRDVATGAASMDSAAEPTTGAEAGTAAAIAADPATDTVAGTAADTVAAVPITGIGAEADVDAPLHPGVPADVTCGASDTLTGDLFASAPARSAPGAAAAVATPESPHGAA